MKRLALLVSAAVLVVGCSDGEPGATVTITETATVTAQPDDADPEPAEVDGEPVDSGAGDLPTWTASSGANAWVCIDDAQGILYWVMVPPEQGGELVQQIEAARAGAGIDGEFTYIPVEVDATGATESASRARELKWATTEQTTVTALTVDDMTSEWSSGIGLDTNEEIDQHNALIDVSNADLDAATPARGAVGEQIFVVEGTMESIVGLTLTTSWYDELICHLEQ